MSITNVNENERENTVEQPKRKKAWVKRRSLSEFSIKIRSIDGVLDGGEIFYGWTGTTQKFSDAPEIIKFIEEQCDIAGYPQSQRKLRGWE